jgi:hypothetical protein
MGKAAARLQQHRINNHGVAYTAIRLINGNINLWLA